MNTVHHRNEIETAVAKLFGSNSSSNADMRDAIMKVAAAVQSIIIEIERTRSR